MQAKGILFDKDGTLFDFAATYAPATSGVLRALAGNEEIASRLGEAAGFDLARQTFHNASVIIAGTAKDMADLWAPMLGLTGDRQLASRIDQLYEVHARRSIALFDTTAACLDALGRAGIVVGLATNDSEANGKAHLAAGGIARHFSFVAGYDSGHGAKPGPGMILAFADHCKSAPAHTVMVGDSLHDLHAARAGGAVGVGVTTGFASAVELAPHADHVIASLQELLALPMICNPRR